MRPYLDLGRAVGRLGMLIVLMIGGCYWLWHREFQLALLTGILLSLIEIEGRLDPSTTDRGKEHG